jgi:hypothetical protein
MTAMPFSNPARASSRHGVNLYHKPSTSLLVFTCLLGIQYISSDAFLGRSTDVNITEQNRTELAPRLSGGPRVGASVRKSAWSLPVAGPFDRTD